MFKVKTDANLPLGIYPSQLQGSDRAGHTAIATDAVPVELYAPGSRYFLYLPLIIGPRRTDGPWYFSTPGSPSPGAIVPDTFLQPGPATEGALVATTSPISIPLASQPLAMAVADEIDQIAILLADGRLQTIDTTNFQPIKTIFIGPNPQTITTDTPHPGQAYLALENELVLVDLPAGQVVKRRPESGRWRSLARDGSTRRLFAVDAKDHRLVVFTDDLSQQLATVKLEEQPDQLVFDPLTRHFYLTFPAVPQIIAFDADSLVITAQTDLIGGPISDLAFDANRQRLIALSALAPTYRGLTVLATPNLSPLNLVAGSEDFPFRTAATLGLTPDGRLLVPENTGLWQITPNSFAVSNLQPGVDLSLVSEIVVSRANKTSYLLDSTAKLLRVYQ
jgi:DNA-binding beta-propeller fold protein YncE